MTPASPLSRRALLTSTTAAALALRSADPARAAARRAGGRFPGDPGPGRLYLGSFVQYPREVDAYERRLAGRLGARRSYFQADQLGGLVARAADDVLGGRLPMVSTKLPGSWRSVARGRHDAWLAALLDGLAALDAPVFLTLNHEPENDVHGRAHRPGWYVEMQERAIDRAAAWAPQVSIVPILMSWTLTPGAPRNPREWLVPSSRLFGFDAYNWWSHRNDLPWTTFGSMLRQARRHAGGRPLVVGEYGVRHDPRRPERPGRWLRNAYAQAVRHDVVAMCYFDNRDGDPDGDFALTGPRLREFRRLLDDPRSVRLAS